MSPVRRQISRHASGLRRNRTDAEDRFWQAVRNRQLHGFKFRFQHTLTRYIADLACLEAMIVELDGSQHSEERDARRTAYLKDQGFEVLRFWNNDVLQNLEGVLTVVGLALARRTEQKKTLTQPSPAEAGED